MSFFQNLKDDLSEAMDELTGADKAAKEEYISDDVLTADDLPDDIDKSLEDEFEDADFRRFSLSWKAQHSSYHWLAEAGMVTSLAPLRAKASQPTLTTDSGIDRFSNFGVYSTIDAPTVVTLLGIVREVRFCE